MSENFSSGDMEKACLTGILSWINFPKESKVLLIDNDAERSELFSKYFYDKCCKATSLDIRMTVSPLVLNQYKLFFDFAVCIETLEYSFDPSKLLSSIKSMLKQDGKLFIGLNNRLGLRYFTGDKDPHTNSVFTGIEDYRFLNYSFIKKNGRCYAKNEIQDLLKSASFNQNKFYSVFPNLQMPQLVYAENYLPNEELSNRYFPLCFSPQTVFLNEHFVIDSLVKNDMFHQMANAYFIECTNTGEFENVNSLTFSFDRGKSDALITKICGDGTVEKCALNTDAARKLDVLHNNMQTLHKRGISIVENVVENEILKMPFIDAPTATTYLKNLFFENKSLFVAEVDRFVEQIRKSSLQVDINELGPIYREGFVDLVPLNSFYKDGEFIFYDQEFCFENYPINAIIYRAVCIIYCDISYTDLLPISFFWERYGITDSQIVVYERLSQEFTDTLRNQKQLFEFNTKYKPHWSSVNQNRNRLNTGVYMYTLIDSCFDEISTKNIVIFGSGKIAEKFMLFYKNDLNILGVFDNNKEKWGTKFYGVPVFDPEKIKDYDLESTKIIICIGAYLQIYTQLLSYGVKHIGIYDPSYFYDGKRYRFQKSKITKKYQVGYIAGVFDLFHVGHLNLLRRAKEQCEYLIVGVCEDDHVTEYKKKEVFVPLEDRLEIVRNCKYVDEAVVIPFKYGSSVDAFRKYHFDVQFSGSDYENDSGWLAVRDFLRQHGSELIFFPYTEKTSSTKIKALIEKGLM